MAQVRKKGNGLIQEKLNKGSEEEIAIQGYEYTRNRTILYVALNILTLGFFFIIQYTFNRAAPLKFTHSKCSSKTAQKLCITDRFGDEYVRHVVGKVKEDDVPKHEERISLCETQLVSKSSQVPKIDLNERYFKFKKIKYVWNPTSHEFERLNFILSSSISNWKGRNESEIEHLLQLFGMNTITIAITPIHKLIVDTITTPLYMYQIFITVVWMIQRYFSFATCVIFMSIISISLYVYETRKQQRILREKVFSLSEVCVMRDSTIQTRPSTSLVPGDIIILSSSSSGSNLNKMECDALLISGTCTVDESSLTGESVPVTKICVANNNEGEGAGGGGCWEADKKSILFAGTAILSTTTTDDAHVKAIVIRTGYLTSKGSLVRSILYSNSRAKLKSDYLKCMALFFVIGVPCMSYTAWRWITVGAPTFEIVIIVIDVATFLVPPLLPAVVTSINSQAQRRLRQVGVYCLDTNYINGAGGLDVICFDKTGTLTEDNIDFAGVISVNEFTTNFNPPSSDASKLNSANNDIQNKLGLIMGCCHSLTFLKNQVEGDTLDVRMFEAANWTSIEDKLPEGSFDRQPIQVLAPKSAANNVFGIFRQFPFESSLQRMGTIVTKSGSNEYLFLMKGAPEMIASFCDEVSLPDDWESVLESYTRDGLRVIAAAYKPLPKDQFSMEGIQKSVKREHLETDLIFVGFILFRNNLKPTTAPVIHQLNTVQIRSIMVTGDNMLTAINVAKNCGMIKDIDAVIQVNVSKRVQRRKLSRQNDVGESGQESELNISYEYAKVPGISEKICNEDSMDRDETLIPMIDLTEDSNLRKLINYHLCLNGDSFDFLRKFEPKLFEKVVNKGTIFARMAPDQKLHLVKELQRQEHEVGMVGDGANDVGALRVANAGISLSVEEASMASPFTYAHKSIECVPILIREGRCTLSATFGAFKYQVSYCFCLLSAVMILFWDGQKPTEYGYIFTDIILNILPPLVFGTTAAASRLTTKKVQRTLFSILPLFSISSYVLIQAFIYITARDYLTTTEWYQKFNFNASRVFEPEESHVQMTVLSLNMMSYVISAIIFCPGAPFRKGFFSNSIYLMVVALNFTLVFIVTVYPAPQTVRLALNFKDGGVPEEFKYLLFGVSLINFGICYLWEKFVVQIVLGDKFATQIRKLRGDIRRHEKIDRAMKESGLWPPKIGVSKRKLSSRRASSSSVTTSRQQSQEMELNEFGMNTLTRKAWIKTVTEEDRLSQEITNRSTLPRALSSFRSQSSTPRSSASFMAGENNN